MTSVHGDGQIAALAKPETSAVPDSSAKLSAESNQLGMTGFVGGAERIAITTGDGLLHSFSGIGHALAYDYHHPINAVKTLAGSVVLAAALKAALPEAGPVGKTASVLMTAWFLVGSGTDFAKAYKTGWNAKDWKELQQSGQQWGDSFGEVAVNYGIGYAGYKIGAGGMGKILSQKKYDNFADSKQEFWDKKTDGVKRFFGKNTAVPTASSVGLRPNYVIEGDSAKLMDSVKDAPERTIIGPANGEAEMNATIVLRSRASTLRMDRYLARMAGGKDKILSDADQQFMERFGSKPESVKAVTDFAKENNLKVEQEDARSGKVYITGKTADFKKAFGVQVNEYAADGTTHIGHDDAISMPKDLAQHVQAVFADDMPTVKPTRVLYKLASDGTLLDPAGNPVRTADQPGPAPAPGDSDANFIKTGGYLATEIAKAQNFPMSTGGEGQHGAFISLSGGIDLADYNKFFPEHGLQQPKPLRITEIDGAKNQPGLPDSGDTENVLDAVQMQSIAPNANIEMLLGKNSDQGLVGVFMRGIFPEAGEAQKSVISSSWGLGEGRQTPQAVSTLGIQFRLAAIRGVQVFAGAGDNGAKANTDFFQPEYPASDPNVTGIGGLKMILNADGTLRSATSWDEGEHSSTGGGISKLFSVPWWQGKLGIKNLDTGKIGRGVPDWSTNAAKATGYPVRVNGSNYVIGGTSAGAPLYAGLMLNINAELGAQGIMPITPLNAWSYARKDDNNIFKNVSTGGNHGYEAAKGWNPVTGLGWVDGQAMLDAMKLNQTARVKPKIAIPGFVLPGASNANQTTEVGTAAK